MMREAGLKALCAATDSQISVYLVQTNQDHNTKQTSKMPHSLYVVACYLQAELK